MFTPLAFRERSRLKIGNGGEKAFSQEAKGFFVAFSSAENANHNWCLYAENPMWLSKEPEVRWEQIMDI